VTRRPKKPEAPRLAHECYCDAPLPVHLLFALHSHTCSCGRRWYPNEHRDEFVATETKR
jgi:hypothetical protein